MNKIICIAAVVLCCSINALSQAPGLKMFPLSAVRLGESVFSKAQQTDAKYILSLDPDRLLAPFLREAGISAKAKSYGNWEGTGLDGHIGGHYITALAQMYASTRDKAFLNKLNYMLYWLEACQKKNGNGYVAAIPNSKALWDEIAKGNIKAGSFSLNDRWVPWYNIHKTYAGLVDAYRLTGSETAKRILVGLSDWCINLTSKLTEAQMQDMLRSEHGGMNEVFADVADITGDKKYLELAKRFSHQLILKPLLENKDQLTGYHANTQIPKVIGFARIAEVSGEKSWNNAADFFWKTVVENRTISIGGNSVREHFNPANDFSSMLESREGPETCNSYNMLKLSRHLFLENPSSKYMDYYERTVYNHILSSQHPDGGFVYFTPIRPNHYRVYSAAQESFWCCVGSGIENHGKYGEMIYAQDGKNLYVNLFFPSTLTWKEKSTTVSQSTNFPFEERSRLRFSMKQSRSFAVKFRKPAWIKGDMIIKVNGAKVKAVTDQFGYISVNRTWNNGDAVELYLPMQTIAEQLPDKSNWISFLRGPIVLAAETSKESLTGLIADDSRMGHIASGKIFPLDEAPLLVKKSHDMSQTLKPLDKSKLTFSMAEAVYQDRYKNLVMKPFFQIHDSRYVMYLPYTTEQDLPQLQAQMREKEKAKMQLEAVTIDLVTAGEQQPESDHNFKGENTESGLFREQHYRNGKGWFSYDLRNPEFEAKRLRVTYFGAEKSKNFDVFMNDVLAASISLDGSEGNKFVNREIEIPAAVTAANTIKVLFKAKPQSAIAGLYEIRLMK